MWRIAHCVYRAFRNTATTHRCSQDVLVPLTSVCNPDDDDEEVKRKRNAISFIQSKCDITHIFKTHQFNYKNIDKLSHYLQKVSWQHFTPQPHAIPSIDNRPKVSPPVEPVAPVPSTTEEPLHSLLQADEACMKTVEELSDLHAHIESTVDLQRAVDALEAGDYATGLVALRASAKYSKNAAAFYNLGICYEEGLGVEADRAKACDYYRQAAALGHRNAQFSLTRLSNQLDDDEDDEVSEPTLIVAPVSPSPARKSVRFSWNHHEPSSSSTCTEHSFEWKTSALTSLS